MRRITHSILCMCAIAMVITSCSRTDSHVEPTQTQTRVPTSLTAFTPTPIPSHPFPNATTTPTPTTLPFLSVTIVDVVTPGHPETELVAVANFGNEDVALTGWQLSDLNKNTFTFPEITLHAHTGLYVHTGNGVRSETDLYWGLGYPAWDEEFVVLMDSYGVTIDTFVVQ